MWTIDNIPAMATPKFFFLTKPQSYSSLVDMLSNTGLFQFENTVMTYENDVLYFRPDSNVPAYKWVPFPWKGKEDLTNLHPKSQFLSPQIEMYLSVYDKWDYPGTVWS